MEVIREKSSLLEASLRNILYNQDTVYIYCNFNTGNANDILEKMLDIDIVNSDGYLVPLSTVDMSEYDNYYMFITNEVKKTIDFVNTIYNEKYNDKKLYLFLENITKGDMSYIKEVFNNMLDVRVHTPFID